MPFKHFIALLLFSYTIVSFNRSYIQRRLPAASVSKANFSLNAFGVESDGFPSIEANIDFLNRSSLCTVTYYDPKYKSKSYKLTQKEIDTLASIIERVDWPHFKKEFSVGKTDQPTSTLILKFKTENIEIKDYGLEGENPLPELYRIVYKLDQNFR